jgi:4-hydroxy-tetrahydrodipicolinate reductase
VQIFFQLIQHFGHAFSKIPGYELHITETHHASKLDAPSGTAKTVRKLLENVGTEAEITSHRTGDSVGDHTIEARSADDRIVLTHEAFSRRGFALGAVRGAEWIADKTGVYDYRDIFAQLS